MNNQERIVRDPQIAGGEPVFKGTRVTDSEEDVKAGRLLDAHAILRGLRSH